jgi:hypothetical protein
MNFINLGCIVENRLPVPEKSNWNSMSLSSSYQTNFYFIFQNSISPHSKSAIFSIIGCTVPALIQLKNSLLYWRKSKTENFVYFQKSMIYCECFKSKHQNRRIHQISIDHVFVCHFLLASVMIYFNGKRGLDVSSSLTDLGHLPG